MSDRNSGAHTGPKIGRTLELARKELGLSLKQVEEATKIRAGYLKELERENFDVLPTVYVQGSLKTYANFLQLDGEALVHELKRRQASRAATQDPAYAEHPKSDYLERALISLGGAAGAGSQEMAEEDAGTAAVSASNQRLYLVSGAFLILILAAAALALTLAGDRQPAVSQVREPLISQAPPEATPVSSEKVERAHQPQQEGNKRVTDNKDDGSQHEKAKDEEAGQTAQTGQNQDDSRPAQDPRDTTASRSAPSTVEPDNASTPPAQRRETGPPPAGGTRNSSPGSRDSGDFDVQIEFGSEDPVRITGNPAND